MIYFAQISRLRKEKERKVLIGSVHIHLYLLNLSLDKISLFLYIQNLIEYLLFMRNNVFIVFLEPKFSDTLSRERINKRRSLSIRNVSKREINLFEMNPDAAACVVKLKRNGIFLALCNPTRSKQKRVSIPFNRFIHVPVSFLLYVLIIIKRHIALFGSL